MIEKKDFCIYPELWDLKINYFNNVNCRTHINSEFEIIVVTEGSLTAIVKDTTYIINKGEGIIILPFESHTFISNMENNCYICLFPSRIDNSFSILSSPKNRVITLDEDSIIMLKKNTTNNKYQFSGIEAKGIIYYLFTNFIKKSDFVVGKKKDNSIFLNAISYINDNFLQEINIETVANELNVSSPSLSRAFKNASGINPAQYISIIRCDYAKTLLLKTNLTIAEIALNSGFSTIRNFNISFLRAFGITPSQCREQKKSLFNN